MRSVDLRINQIESNGRAHVPIQEAAHSTMLLFTVGIPSILFTMKPADIPALAADESGTTADSRGRVAN